MSGFQRSKREKQRRLEFEKMPKRESGDRRMRVYIEMEGGKKKIENLIFFT